MSKRRQFLFAAFALALLAGGAQDFDRLLARGTEIALQTGKDGFEQVLATPEHPQQIERHDIAGAFPDGVDRRFAVMAGYGPLLDVAFAGRE